MSAWLLAACAGALYAAMRVYPGGTWSEPQRSGYSLSENYWCDLLRRPAHNGVANDLGAGLGTCAFVSLAGALSLFFWEISGILPPSWRAAVRTFGVTAAALTALTAVVPSDAFPRLHPPVVLGAGLLGFFSGAACAVWALSDARRRPAFALASASLLAAVGACLWLYVGVAYVPGYRASALPALQKLATLALFAWILLGLREVATEHRPKP